jgi:DNA invertase Pin-like site-specific DNA recombinase
MVYTAFDFFFYYTINLSFCLVVFCLQVFNSLKCREKLILTKYVKEQGWNLVDTYVDDGWSGTDFNRPAVQRLLSDAQSGKINLIICKDLSRFGRNYIEVREALKRTPTVKSSNQPYSMSKNNRKQATLCMKSRKDDYND